MTDKPESGEVAALIERLQTEADQCRNDGANDIAVLLDDAIRTLARLQQERDEARFAPMGDNHHNAAACPYCRPELARLSAPVPAREQPASPPHAAAEPEKPVAWYMPLSGRHAMIEWGEKRPDAGNINEWRPLYASPSAQPIARACRSCEFAKHIAGEVGNARCGVCGAAWFNGIALARIDNALKSAGKE